ncbi:hypothetical protein, partial [Oleiphilus sp. HI0125]
IQLSARGLFRHYNNHPDLFISYDEIDLAEPEETTTVAEISPKRFEPLAENILQTLEDLKVTDDTVIEFEAIHVDNTDYNRQYEKQRIGLEKMQALSEKMGAELTEKLFTTKDIVSVQTLFNKAGKIRFSLADLYVMADEVARYENKKDGVMTLPQALSGLPESIQIAADVYEQCWHDLPSEMKRPSKKDLHDYIESRHKINQKSVIDAIIKVSVADDMKLGGKPAENE